MPTLGTPVTCHLLWMCEIYFSSKTSLFGGCVTTQVTSLQTVRSSRSYNSAFPPKASLWTRLV